LERIAPRLARARDELLADRRRERARRRWHRERELHLEWLVAHRDLQLVRAGATRRAARNAEYMRELSEAEREAMDAAPMPEGATWCGFKAGWLAARDHHLYEDSRIANACADAVAHFRRVGLEPNPLIVGGRAVDILRGRTPAIVRDTEREHGPPAGEIDDAIHIAVDLGRRTLCGQDAGERNTVGPRDPRPGSMPGCWMCSQIADELTREPA
jgi:hypothetical protein